MKIAVIYYSKTGHSKKIAESIAKAINVKAENIKSKPVLNEVDLLFIVGGIYGGVSFPEMKEYIEGIKNTCAKKASLITSCMSEKQGQDIIRETLTRNEIEVISEEFICKGSFLFMGLGHPNKEEINSAISFAKKVISDNA